MECRLVTQLYKTGIYWFRRSLRLDDNRALVEAVKACESVLPVFILDPSILTDPATGPARVHFLLESLHELDRGLREIGSRLILRHGQPVPELLALVRETGAVALFFSRDYEPYSTRRDTAVTAAMQEIGVALRTESDHLLVEPDRVRSQAGTPYTVFTPFKRVWMEMPIEAPVSAPERIRTPADLHSEALPTLINQIGTAGALDQQPLVHGGESQATEHRDRFILSCLKEYGVQRDFPAVEGTSRLSAYLKFGVLSARRLVSEMRRRGGGLTSGGQIFLSELCWRDFYYQILANFPHVADGAFRPAYNAIEWDNDPVLFQAWCEGRTGYPFVDAAMRQMNAEAWMHNRARMVTASFLTKDLLCDWRWGERYFMQKLVDGDLASNNGGWQWAAGTGTDAQPFFRIFNPVSQGEKFDSDGAYVRKYVPELARYPAKFIHRPWELRPAEQEAVGCVIGRDYPAPIVDHKVQREKTLAAYRRATSEGQS